jgi:N-glycosylase/DNA lyase
LSERERAEAGRQVRRILGLDEDLGPFYAMVRGEPSFAWIETTGGGRILRAPTVFEDLVKMICTTNCSWSLTDRMVRRLVSALGRPLPAPGRLPGRGRGGAGDAAGPSAGPNGTPLRAARGRTLPHGKGFMLRLPAPGQEAFPLRAFPEPAGMAALPERFYRDEVRTGYRSGALRSLAERVASGRLDVEAWERSDRPTADVKREILSVRGVGPYAAEGLLRLLGRHDGLALDSWCRSKFARLHSQGRRVTDARIERFYARFGRFRGLALWCDLTRDWLDGRVGESG